MFYVYVLLSMKDKRFYVGYSDNLKRRLSEHIKGKVESTKNRLPIELVYYEAYRFDKDARQQELFYKTGQGRRVLNKRLKNIKERCESG